MKSKEQIRSDVTEYLSLGQLTTVHINDGMNRTKALLGLLVMCHRSSEKRISPGKYKRSKSIAGDLSLVNEIVSASDTHKGTRSFATVTSTPDDGIITPEEHLETHMACASTMVDCKGEGETTLSDEKMNSNGIAKCLTHAFNGHKISQRESDGYINATDMCNVRKGKKMTNWRRNQKTCAYLLAISTTTGIPVHRLVESKAGNHLFGGGTWIHPETAIHLAMWVDDVFAAGVVQWTCRFITGDLTLVNDLVSASDAIKGTRSFATITSTADDGCITPDVHLTTHTACASAMVDCKRERECKPTWICALGTQIDSGLLGNCLTQIFNGHKIPQRTLDGYINAT